MKYFILKKGFSVYLGFFFLYDYIILNIFNFCKMKFYDLFFYNLVIINLFICDYYIYCIG